jgi:site-specific DNA-methyltransferase (adenine-specific)
MIQLFKGDCIEIMQEIKPNSIDAIICDLPYGTTQNAWDSIIDLNLLWNHIWRICKTNSPVLLFSAQPFTTTLIHSQPKYYKYEWIWVKNLKTGNLNARKMPMGGHETIQVFYKKPPTYKPQKRRRTTEIKSGNTFNSKTSNYGKQKDLYTDRQGDLINPDTVIKDIKCVHNSNGKVHPTQKPIALCEYLINTYTNIGDVVLDMTMGSGTTGIACRNTNRNFIGIELNDRYFEIATERINKTENTLF